MPGKNVSPTTKPEFEIDTTDDEGRRVVWHKKSFDKHVLYRPELRQVKNHIRKALQQPYRKRKLKGAIEHYYSDIVRFGKLGDIHWQVIVLYVGLFRKTGYIKSAHPVTEVSN